MNAELERRILACPTLPTLPAVVLQIIRLCHGDEIDLRRIADALASDPALTARVLRAANSASVAARGKVGTLTRAVPLLGSKAVTAIALSFALVRCRRKGDTGSGFDRAAYWRRAVFAALAGRTLAEGAAPSVDPEEAFIAALLQDLGMLALSEVFSSEYGTLCARAGGDHDALVASERKGWGADHSDVGALLARSWRLPQALEHAVAASHGEPSTPNAPEPGARLVDCVALSGRLADLWVAPGAAEAPRSALEAICDRLGFDPAVLEAVMARMALAVPETSADFDIDLGGPARVDEVLSGARRLLADLGLAAPEDAPASAEAGEALDRAMRFAFACARRRREPLALLLFSPEHPAPGSASSLLRAVRHLVRSTDLLGTSGRGEEVFLLCAGADLEGGLAVARRLMQGAASLPGTGLSIGVTSNGPHFTAQADRARLALVEAMAAALAAGGGQILAVDMGRGARRENDA